MKKALSSPYVLLTFVPLIWSTNFIIGKYFVNFLPPVTMTLGRFLIAAVVLSPWTYQAIRSGLLQEKKLLKQVLLLGITGVTLFNSLVYTGLHYTTAINSTLIGAFYPMIAVILSVLWLKERVKILQLIGFAFAIIGVLWIQVEGSWLNLINLNFNPGDLLVLLATILWAYYSVLGKIVMARIPPIQLTALGIFFGVIFLIPISAVELSYTTNIYFGWEIVAGLLYLGIFPSVVAIYLWLNGVNRVGAARAANFYSLVPVFGTILAILFLGEKLTIPQLTGGAMVLLGVFCSSLKQRTVKLEEEPEKAIIS